MMNQFLLISYDISDDKRRLKVMKALQDHGKRVQYSVFECRLRDKQLARLKERLKPLVKEPQDSVRIYYICADDVVRLEVIGKGSVTKDNVYYLY